MGRLLKYAIVLAWAVAIPAYIVLGPPSFDDLFPHRERETLAARPEPAVSAPIEQDLDYKVAQRLASLDGWRAFLSAHPTGAYARVAQAEIRRLGSNGAATQGDAGAPALAATHAERGDWVAQGLSYAQSATAKVEGLFLPEKAPASGTPDVSSGPSVSPSAADAVPAAMAAVSSDASHDAKEGANESAGRAAPMAGTDVAAGAQLAALSPNEICQRDEDRLARLRSSPSSEEARRFANELGCEKLRPQVLSLTESLSPSLAAAGGAPVTSSEAQAAGETGGPAPPLAGADVAAPTPDACQRDEDRLARLRLSPSSEEAQRFASELTCETLRPQLQRLMESLGFLAPARAIAMANSSISADSLLTPACAKARAALDRLRHEPTPDAADSYWRELRCEALRPQVRLLLESLNITPEPVNASPAPDEAGGRVGALAANGADPVVCRKETAELNRIRAAPDLGDAKRFASSMICDALKPQATRLLESLSER